jgi:hypothetical protein
MSKGTKRRDVRPGTRALRGIRAQSIRARSDVSRRGFYEPRPTRPTRLPVASALGRAVRSERDACRHSVARDAYLRHGRASDVARARDRRDARDPRESARRHDRNRSHEADRAAVLFFQRRRGANALSRAPDRTGDLPLALPRTQRRGRRRSPRSPCRFWRATP